MLMKVRLFRCVPPNYVFKDVCKRSAGSVEEGDMSFQTTPDKKRRRSENLELGWTSFMDTLIIFVAATNE